jgi:hypothetical protein
MIRQIAIVCLTILALTSSVNGAGLTEAQLAKRGIYFLDPGGLIGINTTESCQVNLSTTASSVLSQPDIDGLAKALPLYREGAKRVGVPWQILPPIHRQESYSLSNPGLNYEGTYEGIAQLHTWALQYAREVYGINSAGTGKNSAADTVGALRDIFPPGNEIPTPDKPTDGKFFVHISEIISDAKTNKAINPAYSRVLSAEEQFAMMARFLLDSIPAEDQQKLTSSTIDRSRDEDVLRLQYRQYWTK